jgi:hypothetical protein
VLRLPSLTVPRLESHGRGCTCRRCRAAVCRSGTGRRSSVYLR